MNQKKYNPYKIMWNKLKKCLNESIEFCEFLGDTVKDDDFKNIALLDKSNIALMEVIEKGVLGNGK